MVAEQDKNIVTADEDIAAESEKSNNTNDDVDKYVSDNILDNIVDVPVPDS